MADFQNRKKTENWFYSPLALILIALVAGFFVYKLIGIMVKGGETADKKRESLAHLEELENQKATLIESLENLETDWGSEKAIVDKFRVAKEGEGLIVILEPDEN